MQKQTILIVDDQVVMLELLKHILDKTYNVKTISEGKKALSYLHLGELPDLILADLNMPGLSGFEFIEKVRISDYFSDIPIIILSGQEGSTEKIRCLKLGANDYVIKPFNPEELSLRIKNLLNLMTSKK